MKRTIDTSKLDSIIKNKEKIWKYIEKLTIDERLNQLKQEKNKLEDHIASLIRGSLWIFRFKL